MAEVTWDSIRFECSLAMFANEAVAGTTVTISRWRDIQTTAEASNILNNAMKEAWTYCQSPGREVRNPYNRVVPVRSGIVVIVTDKQRQLVRGSITAEGRTKTENSDLSPAAALVAAVKKWSAFDDAEEVKQRVEAERRQALARAQEEARKQEIERQKQEMERQKQAALELDRRKQAALSDCGAAPALSGSPWFDPTYKIAALETARTHTGFFCVKTVEYIGPAPNPFGGKGAQIKLIGYGRDYTSRTLTDHIIY